MTYDAVAGVCGGSATVRARAKYRRVGSSLLDMVGARWHEAVTFPIQRVRHENVLPPLLHLVERPDVRHPAVDVALWRAGGRGRIRQPLLPHAEERRVG